MMNKLSTVGALLISFLFSCGAAAQDVADTQSTAVATPAPAQSKPLVVGAQMGLGFGWAVRNKNLQDAMDDAGLRNTVGFSGGGWLYVDYYIIPMLAVEGGLGFVAKGTHFKEEQGNDDSLFYKFAYMQFPLGLKLNLINIRVTALMLLDIALTGKSKIKSGGTTVTEKWGDSEWDDIRRFNLGLQLGVGYAIPVGPVAIVPGANWSMQFIDLYKNDIPEAFRLMNVFFNVSVEYGIPI
jgi:hypothetical protein